MDRTRWEILVLAAAILVGALAIASSMRANRYAYMTDAGIGDTQTGAVYSLGTPNDAERLANIPKEERKVWIRVVEPVK
jgi:hypothetical protein